MPLTEEPDGRTQARDRQQERGPAVGHLAGQPGSPRAERGEVDRDLRRGGDRQPERPVRALGRGRKAFTVQQPTYLPCHGRQPFDGRSELHVVEPLGQRRAAGPETEHEASTRDLVERRGQHRDAGWGTPPHVEYAGAQRDPAGTSRDLGQQHRGVVAPPLGEEEGVVPQVFRTLRDMEHDRAPGFHRGQADGEALPGHACTLRPVCAGVQTATPVV